MKPPIIRPGQCQPYVKATRGQIAERIGYVARLLRAGGTKFQIHRAVRETFGVEWRQCDRYMAHVRTRVWSPETYPATDTMKAVKKL